MKRLLVLVVLGLMLLSVVAVQGVTESPLIHTEVSEASFFDRVASYFGFAFLWIDGPDGEPGDIIHWKNTVGYNTDMGDLYCAPQGYWPAWVVTIENLNTGALYMDTGLWPYTEPSYTPAIIGVVESTYMIPTSATPGDEFQITFDVRCGEVSVILVEPDETTFTVLGGGGEYEAHSYRRCWPDDDPTTSINDVYWYDSNGVRQEKYDDCSSGEVCANIASSTMLSDAVCIPRMSYQACYGDEVWWYDSEDRRTTLIDSCGVDEICTEPTSTTAICKNTCDDGTLAGAGETCGICQSTGGPYCQSGMSCTSYECVINPYCGDGTCNNGETENSCPADCTAPDTCGDGDRDADSEECDGQDNVPTNGYCSNQCEIVCNEGYERKEELIGSNIMATVGNYVITCEESDEPTECDADEYSTSFLENLGLSKGFVTPGCHQKKEFMTKDELEDYSLPSSVTFLNVITNPGTPQCLHDDMCVEGGECIKPDDEGNAVEVMVYDVFKERFGSNFLERGLCDFVDWILIPGDAWDCDGVDRDIGLCVEKQVSLKEWLESYIREIETATGFSHGTALAIGYFVIPMLAILLLNLLMTPRRR